MRGKTFRYLYDFGDAWEHSVKIRASLLLIPIVAIRV
jgi:hypothetical protein